VVVGDFDYGGVVFGRGDGYFGGDG